MDYKNLDDELRERFMRLLKEIGALPTPATMSFTPKNVWDRLAAEGNHTTIEKLRNVEAKTDGFGTIVITKEGFSENDDTHNAVLDWLKQQKVNILNVPREIYQLKRALHDGVLL
ncbi:MAG: hypothetical protein D4S01_05130 [Dehalococcoidia bacterium]|nr:MAG: hypothetical protein D4S01_05130 [Dehalococcoidia bacterium]